jgi:sortase A
MAIVEGTDEHALYRGAWRIPTTSTPDQGGNTVVSAHRFQYRSGPNTLMLLDKVQAGDPVIVYWQGKEYDFRVTSQRIVHKTQVEILRNTPEPILTIFTCNPPYRYNAEERLVVFAEALEEPATSAEESR